MTSFLLFQMFMGPSYPAAVKKLKSYSFRRFIIILRGKNDIAGLFLDISKKTQGQKTSSKYSKKLKQIIWKLNITGGMGKADFKEWIKADFWEWS